MLLPSVETINPPKKVAVTSQIVKTPHQHQDLAPCPKPRQSQTSDFQAPKHPDKATHHTPHHDHHPLICLTSHSLQPQKTRKVIPHLKEFFPNQAACSKNDIYYPKYPLSICAATTSSSTSSNSKCTSPASTA